MELVTEVVGSEGTVAADGEENDIDPDRHPVPEEDQPVEEAVDMVEDLQVFAL